ncbi:DUF6660 family protein [Flavobacterium sp. SM2513]|uniref:DUF6660 family protein n=1 Tax=Flavobacterium sp. SM2513 TaxID=3424766 RepID=UPI003D7FF018
MKWKQFLLALYIIMVSFYPCTDSDATFTTSNAVEIAHNHDGHSHDEERHACPPFCVCNCCGVQMLNYAVTVTIDFPIPFQSIPLKESFYVSNLSDSYSGSIWQPPQLV